MDKIAAIWARVSTEGQAELSLDSQVQRAKAKLEAEGYMVLPEHTFRVDWSSLDLDACPEFQKLKALLMGKKVNAIGMLDRDRLECKPSQRVKFLTDCKENGVKPIVCQGPPFLEGDEGDLIEFVLAMGKRRSVERARQSSKDGLHDRAVLKGLPTSHHRIFGFQWEGETMLIPDDNWEKVKLIWDMALAGKTYDTIIREYERRGFLSPGGKPELPKPTISAILHNPVYGGRYYALKKEAVQPTNRKGDNTYGNTSSKKLPSDQWHHLPSVKVTNPPVSWEDYLSIQERLRQNQELAQRNGKADYLLRGFIFCDYHRGQHGEPRRYHGQPRHGSWRYACPIGGCAHPYLHGPKIEEVAKFHACWLIDLQPDEFYERISNKRNREEQEQTLRRELKSLEARYNRNINNETELEHRNLLGLEHEEVYQRLKARFRAERQWIEDRKLTISEELAQLNHQGEAVTSLQQIQGRVRGRLDELTKAEWRELFAALNLEIHVRDKDDPATWPEHWWEKQGMPPDESEIEICFGLPLRTERVGSIALKCPAHG